MIPRTARTLLDLAVASVGVVVLTLLLSVLIVTRTADGVPPMAHLPAEWREATRD